MKPFTSAVILAAGSATRMKGTDKIMLPVNGKPLIYYTIKAFELSDTIDEIIIVTRDEIKKEISKAVEDFNKIKDIVSGGSCRVVSAKNGFSAISKTSCFIAVHDGARPLITPEDIDKINTKAYVCNAVCCGYPVTDTIKQVDEKGIIIATPDRSKLFAVATPQVFSVDVYKKAIDNAMSCPQNFTDDSGMVEAVGVEVKTVLCKKNIKVTSPEDIEIIKFLTKSFQ